MKRDFGRGEGLVPDIPKTSRLIWQDTQHRRLFEILELLRQPETSRQALDQLKSYIDSHFALEEEYMRRLDYSDYESHTRAHRQFQKEIEELCRYSESDSEDFLATASTFLTEWLTRHVMGVDKELEAAILASDLR
ncbi:MAG: bacteriohemerythrin [Parahaliea sp.]